MPKFLAGCYYNEEEICRHLKKHNKILAGPNWWQQVCNRSNPEKTGRNCEGTGWAQKSPEPWSTRLWSLENNLFSVHLTPSLVLEVLVNCFWIGFVTNLRGSILLCWMDERYVCTWIKKNLDDTFIYLLYVCTRWFPLPISIALDSSRCLLTNTHAFEVHDLGVFKLTQVIQN